MKTKVRVAFSFAVILIASGATFLGVLSFFAEPLVDQGNPPTGNVYRFFGGIIMPNTPYFFWLAAMLFGSAAAILKTVSSSKLAIVFYHVALRCCIFAVLVALVCAGILLWYGHKYL